MGTSSSLLPWPLLLLPSTPLPAFPSLEPFPDLPPDPLLRLSGISSSFRLSLLPEGRRDPCLSREPLVLSPDPLPRLSGTSSSLLPWPLLLLPSTPLPAFPSLEPFPDLPPDPPLRLSGISSSCRLSLLPEGRSVPCLFRA